MKTQQLDLVASEQHAKAAEEYAKAEIHCGIRTEQRAKAAEERAKAEIHRGIGNIIRAQAMKKIKPTRTDVWLIKKLEYTCCFTE